MPKKENNNSKKAKKVDMKVNKKAEKVLKICKGKCLKTGGKEIKNMEPYEIKKLIIKITKNIKKDDDRRLKRLIKLGGAGTFKRVNV